MRSQIFALGLAGVAAAAYAPPSYGEETSSAPAAPAYGESTSAPAAPAYESTSSTPAAPAYESTSTPVAPGYGWSSSSESVPSYPETTTSAPAYGPTTVTDVVSEYTTYCPEATTLTHGGVTYTVSSATTLTITSCYGGCTKETSAPATWAVSSSSSVPYSPVETSPVAPVYSSATWATSASVPYYPTGASNATTPAGTGYPSASASQPAAYTGAASNVAAGAMVGFSGLIAALFM